MICPFCACELNDGEKVCPHCGANPEAQNAPEAGAAQQAADTAENDPTAAGHRKKKTGLITAAVLAAVLLMAGAFCLWFFLLRVPSAESLVLSANEAELHVGEKTTVTYTILPEKAGKKEVRWSSSNEAVATVDQNGEITAKTGGVCVITAAVDKQSADVEIRVKMLELSETALSLYRGEQYTLNCTVYQEAGDTKKVVEWTSSNDDVATVDQDGVIHAVSAGECTIAASLEGHSVEAKVTVDAKSRTEASVIGNWNGVMAINGNDQLKYNGVLQLNDDDTGMITEGNNVIGFHWFSFEMEDRTIMMLRSEDGQYSGYIFLLEDKDILAIALNIMDGTHFREVDLYFERAS